MPRGDAEACAASLPLLDDGTIALGRGMLSNDRSRRWLKRNEATHRSQSLSLAGINNLSLNLLRTETPIVLDMSDVSII